MPADSNTDEQLTSYFLQSMEDGMTLDELFEYTNIDPWFLNQLAELHQAEQWLKAQALTDISRDDFIQTKKRGFSDLQISRLTGMPLFYTCCSLIWSATCL